MKHQLVLFRLSFDNEYSTNFILSVFNSILDHMISNKHRFHGHNSLRYVYAHGRTVRSTVLGIRIAENSRQSKYRCAVVVSKKISKSAVQRNRMRRRIYEIIRRSEPIMSVSVDIVVTVYNESVATMPANELENTIIKLLKQAKIVA